MSFLEAFRDEVLVIDGAMGTMVQSQGFEDADFGGPEFRMLTDLLTFAHPRCIKDIHVEYLRAGAHAIETNTFGASPFRLSEYDFSRLDLARFQPIPYTKHGQPLDIRGLSYEEFAYYLSRRAAELACKARDEYRRSPDYDGRPLVVLGAIGPSNRVLSSTLADLRTSTFDAVAENFRHQVRGLLEGGVDALLYETQQDVLELKAAIFGGRKAIEEAGRPAPILVQVTVDQHARMPIFNTDIHAALVAVQDMGIDAFGINCSIGPDQMGKALEKLARYCRLPISVVPNAGLPISENGKTVFRFAPEKMAAHLRDFVTEYGVGIVGGCCGTTPDHIRAVVEAVRGNKPKARRPERGIYVSGPQEAVRLDSSEALITIGERLNVRGSKKVRDAVEGGGPIDHAALEAVVQEQVRDLGVKVIDVCMDSNVVDTTEALKDVIHKQTADFSGAMSIDSFSVEALAEAAKVYPGRPILNSISMEEVAPGVTKADAVLSATHEHGAVYIGLATGPQGPGVTAAEKAELARLIVERAARYGVGPERLFLDMNVFPIGSESQPGMNFALESLRAVPLIKAIHPDVRTICGVGNLTSGLAKKPYMRLLLTSVWLDEARKRGLDAAIVNPNHYVFVRDLDPRDYELGLKSIMEHDMDAFAELEIIADKKKGREVVRRDTYDDLELEAALCQKIVDGYKEPEDGSVELNGYSYRYSDRIVLQAAQAVGKHDPLDLINAYLMKAMQDLGDGFAQGEVSLPHLLRSADVMKHVMRFLEEYMRVSSGADLLEGVRYKGTVVIGTVYQDVHCIGKDLARTLLENYGYRVIDLGGMTPLETFIDAAKEHHADAVAMSALLVQTSNHMIAVSRMMLEQGLAQTAVLIGGAPVNDRHAAYVAMAGGDDPSRIRSNVFYCATAMDGVNTMNALRQASDVTSLLEANRRKLLSSLERARAHSHQTQTLLAKLPRRYVGFDGPPPELTWIRHKKVFIPLTAFAPHIDLKTLFGLNWKFGGPVARAKRGETEERLEQLFQAWVTRADKHDWIRPQGLYGLYPCQSDGDEVVVYDPDDLGRELCRLDFSVVIGGERKDTVCAAQYFRPKGTGAMDAVGVQLSTAGPQVDDQLRAFREVGDSESVLYLQGLSDRVAEDVAEWLHATLRETAGFGGARRGIRWSPGYPAITNLENNGRIFGLLDAGGALGIRLTDAGEFSPTSTTAAIVCLHPESRYT